MTTGFRPSRKFSHKGSLRTPSILESHGPGGKVRGTASQLVDRYVSLGRDALREGDHVMAEAFFQHAEHYRRLLGSYISRRPITRDMPEAPLEENSSLGEENMTENELQEVEEEIIEEPEDA